MQGTAQMPPSPPQQRKRHAQEVGEGHDDWDGEPLPGVRGVVLRRVGAPPTQHDHADDRIDHKVRCDGLEY